MTSSSATGTPPMPDPPRPRPLIQDCQMTAMTCGHVSRILSEHASKQKTIQHLLRAVNFVVGIGVVLATLLALASSFKALAGEHVVATLALIAAVVLLADAALPSILPEPNPERFKDYALYLRSYVQELKALETDAKLDAVSWDTRVLEIVRLARMNLDDVFRQWPRLVPKLQKCGCKEYWES